MDKKNELKWNMAALGALADGDWNNALIAATPGGIEAQEARGQRDFVANETLPVKINGGSREQFEAMGIVFLDRGHGDDLFVPVHLPQGWKKVPTDHSMWSDLVDDKGRKRASVFYKAAFYDRDAFMGVERRFHYGSEPILGYNDPNYREGGYHCVVTDCGKVIWKSEEQVEPEPPYDEDRQTWLDWQNRRDGLARLGKAWLDEHCPLWEDCLAYWEENNVPE